ncbi:hypothetical protein SAY86_004117 [Trapa natans]|uniref:Uncharacterized protein n=1 Tax=Trapa natans TaxID=22666 RepID=A0AAN7MDW8_TRANT|nr:hypothetical protein SAY86_004117 [Trapa natans]
MDTAELTTEQVLKRDIPWETYMTTKLITGTCLQLLRRYDKRPDSYRAQLLEEDGPAYVRVFVCILRDIFKEETVEYVLALIDEMLAANPKRARLFHDGYLANEDIYEPFLSNFFIQEKSCKILALIISSRPRSHGKSVNGEESSSKKKLTTIDDVLKGLVEWLSAQLKRPSHPSRTVPTAINCLSTLLKEPVVRSSFVQADGIKLLIPLISPASTQQSIQLLYETCLCVWLLSYFEPATDYLATSSILPRLMDVVKSSTKEKVVRVVVLTFKNFLAKEVFGAQMVDLGLLQIVESLKAQAWSDEDLLDALNQLEEGLRQNIKKLSSFDKYKQEILLGHLDWSPVHKDAVFWRENISSFEENDFQILRVLITILDSSSEPRTLAVACFDLSQFIQCHPAGRIIATDLKAKERIMKLLNHENGEMKNGDHCCVYMWLTDSLRPPYLITLLSQQPFMMKGGCSAGEESSLRRRRDRSKKKLRTNTKVEVRSHEDGFFGSWHQGVVKDCGFRRRCVMYDHIISEDGSHNYVEHVEVSPCVDGVNTDEVSLCNYRGSIRPKPPYFVIGPWDLPYGSCVDVYHMDAWWEGVIFDHNDGGEERAVFFPDLGDEMLAKLATMRATLVWDEATESWHRRGSWLFLQVIEQCEEEWPLPVSVKQIWYDLRERDEFKGIKEWTCTDTGAWKGLVVKTIMENLMVVLDDALPTLAISWQQVVPAIDDHVPRQVESVNEGFIVSQDQILASPCSAPELPRTGEDNPVRNGMIQKAGDVVLYQGVDDSDQPVEPSVDGAIINFNDTDFQEEPRLAITPGTLMLTGSPEEKERSPRVCRTPMDWKLAGPNLIPEAGAFPEAIAMYVTGRDSKYNDSLVERARRHLLYLGWKIEFRIGKGDLFRFRYISPAGKCCQSLIKACMEVSGATDQAGRSAFIDDPGNGFVTNSSPSHLRIKGVEDPNMASGMPKVEEPQENLSAVRRKAKSSPRKRKRESPSISLKEMSYNHSGSDRKVDGGIIVKWHPQDDEDATSSSKKSKAKASRGSIKTHGTRTLRSSKRIKVAGPNLCRNGTIISWLIANKTLLPGTRVYYRGENNRIPIAHGHVTAAGIECDCCTNIFSLRRFGIHAAKTDQRAASNIFLEDGRSLLSCQMDILQEKNEKNNASGREQSGWIKGHNDSVCSVCHYGGELVLCDGCPSSFHLSCIGMSEVPDGDWFCPSCCCRMCKKREAGDTTANCVGNSILICDQCSAKYHFDCVTSKDANISCRFRRRNWFCGKKCEEIYLALYKMIGKITPLGKDNLTWTLLRSLKANDCCDLEAHDIDTVTQIDCKLNFAVDLMHDCFENVNEKSLQGDIIENVIFSRGSELNRLNFQGFYTMILEKDDDLVSVATIRIHGNKVAEVPLVCTRHSYRQMGMCHLLMEELEKTLKELGIYQLVLPSIPDVLGTWTTSFGFIKMTESERLQFLNYTFLDFQDTIMCHKELLKEPTA